jgi:hypothetical protein
MTEWWTYRPEDFLLFSERVYWRLFEIHNQALWPAQPVAIGFGVIILFLVFRPRSWSGRMISAVMTVSWLFVAWAYHWNTYATINWAAKWAAFLFAVEAALFAWFGVFRDKLTFAMRRNPRSILRVLLFVYAVFIHPFIPLLTGKPLTAAEIFALTPDPTAIATLGLLGLSAGGSSVLMLLLIPIAWCLVSWGTLFTMGTWEAWIPIAAVLFVVVTRPWRQAPIER